MFKSTLNEKSINIHTEILKYIFFSARDEKLYKIQINERHLNVKRVNPDTLFGSLLVFWQNHF